MITPCNQTVSIFAKFPSIGFKSYEKRFQITIDAQAEFDSIINTFATLYVNVKLQQKYAQSQISTAPNHQQYQTYNDNNNNYFKPSPPQEFAPQLQMVPHSINSTNKMTPQTQSYQNNQSQLLSSSQEYNTSQDVSNSLISTNRMISNYYDYVPHFRSASRSASRSSIHSKTPSFGINNHHTPTTPATTNTTTTTTGTSIAQITPPVSVTARRTFTNFSPSFTQEKLQTTVLMSSSSQSRNITRQPTPSKSTIEKFPLLSQIVKRPDSERSSSNERPLKEYTLEEIVELLKERLNDPEFIEFVGRVEEAIGFIDSEG